MRLKLWWTVNRDTGKVIGYALKSPVESIKVLAFDAGLKETERIVIYELETDITPEIIIALLNGKFNHCMFSNYQAAKSLKIER